MTTTGQNQPLSAPDGRSPTVSPTLDALYLCCDRFAHAIRTHLGVALGAVEDLAAGIALEPADIKDALQALRQILNALEALRPFSNAPVLNMREFSLTAVVDEAVAQLSPLARSQTPSHRYTRTGDPVLLRRALECLIRYASGRRTRGNHAGAVEVRLSDMAGASLIGICSPGTFPTSMHGRYTLSQLAHIDHSPEALGLLYADAALALHGGGADITLNSEQLEIAITFYHQENGNPV